MRTKKTFTDALTNLNPADTQQLLSKLTSETVAVCIEELLNEYNLKTKPVDLYLSRIFFLLSEIPPIQKEVRDFCLDTANFIALTDDSRIVDMDIRHEFAKIKTLANVTLPAPR